mmetsp:Transcript_3462/g.12482  ORF Transcript_3462/g.12482 Transcript_3462/m.12482 type:complete len:212 (-) Transcript_3462:103-738(-)
MRFHFCGGLDAPDWLLAEISILSRISSVRIKLLAQQIVHKILESDKFDYGKIAKLAGDLSGGDSDMKASVASLHFILSHAAGHAVDDVTLVKELQQLGLPKEHSESVCRPYREYSTKLREKLASQTPQIGGVDQVHWDVSYVLFANGSAEAASSPKQGERVVHLALQQDPCQQQHPSSSLRFAMSASKAEILLAELRRAKAGLEQAKASLS